MNESLGLLLESLALVALLVVLGAVSIGLLMAGKHGRKSLLARLRKRLAQMKADRATRSRAAVSPVDADRRRRQWVSLETKLWGIGIFLALMVGEEPLLFIARPRLSLLCFLVVVGCLYYSYRSDQREHAALRWMRYIVLILLYAYTFGVVFLLLFLAHASHGIQG